MISDKTLYDFCVLYRQRFGQKQDATRFRNELELRFYHVYHGDLYERCLQQNLFRQSGGNIIFNVDGRGKGL